MQVVISKKKKYIILLLGILVLSAITAGIYLFINPRTNDSTSYSVNKYSDVANWCDTTLKDENLSVDCKALLINIDSNSCFEIQVITKDKELKDLTICEKNDNLSYTNDVLGYKKLMPVDMVFTYTKEGILGDYSFNNVSFSKVDDTYIQNIVNEDIANLVKIIPNKTKIETNYEGDTKFLSMSDVYITDNSVDFCPRPEKLPDYISDKNKNDYKAYIMANSLTENDYNNKYLYSWDDNTIRILFACDSTENKQFQNICNKTQLYGINSISSGIKHLSATPVWDKKVEENEIALLKEISLIYDSLYLKEQKNNIANLSLLKNFVDEINNTKSISGEVFCGIGKIYDAIDQNDQFFKADSNRIKDEVLNNIAKQESPFCTNLLDSTLLDKTGKYLLNYYRNNNLRNKCLNLAAIIY